MFTPDRATVFALGFLFGGATPLIAAEPIGTAVEIKTAVTGTGGEFAINDPVHRDERIRTSQSGLGQFVFRDGTKLAVGWGSSVVVDKFVFDDANSVKKLTIKAAKGTFRWVSGNSKHTAYEILTPAGTIGVRGTAFDFYIGRDGTTAIVLLGGAASFCSAGGCKQLTRRCDCIIAKRNGNMSDVSRVNRGVFTALGNTKALPFLSGNQTLSAMRGYGGCGLSASVDVPRDDHVTPDRRDTQPAPQTPDRIQQPDKPQHEPGKHHGDHGKGGGKHGDGDHHGGRDKPGGDRGWGGHRHDRDDGDRADYGGQVDQESEEGD